DFSSSGTLHVKDASWSDDSTRLSGVDATAKFSLEPDRLSVSRLTARLLGGSMTGDAQVVHWLSSAPSGREAPQGSARLNISGVELARAEAVLSNLPRVLTQLRLASAIAGKSELRWKGSPTNLEAEFALELSAPNEVSPAQVPVHGTVNGSYSG